MYVPQIEMSDHLLQAHHCVECTECHEMIEKGFTYTQHLLHCPMRVMTCEMCHNGIRVGDYESHCREHAKGVRQTISEACTIIVNATQELGRIEGILQSLGRTDE
jgi:hypothetical protein